MVGRAHQHLSFALVLCAEFCLGFWVGGDDVEAVDVPFELVDALVGFVQGGESAILDLAAGAAILIDEVGPDFEGQRSRCRFKLACEQFLQRAAGDGDLADAVERNRVAGTELRELADVVGGKFLGCGQKFLKLRVLWKWSMLE